MKICMSISEMRKLESILKTSSEDQSMNLEKFLHQNTAVKYKLWPLNQVELDIKEEYVVEYFAIIVKYLSMVLPQVKALFATFEALTEEGIVFENKWTLLQKVADEVSQKEGDTNAGNQTEESEHMEPAKE